MTPLSFFQSFAIIALQTLFLILIAPMVRTAIRKVKARLQNRVGPSLFQGYFDLWKLFQKESVFSKHSSFVFRMTPFVLFGTTAVVAMLMPAIFSFSPLGFQSDLLLMVYLLALGTFFLVLAGLDSGSAFGGMGSSREVTIYSLTEPAAILSLFALGFSAQSTNVYAIVAATLENPQLVFAVSHVFVFLALVIVSLAENARIPVDNPATHLELTMVHEAMILEYSGRQLALVEWASSIKLTIFFVLLANVFVPFGLAQTLDISSIAIAAATLMLKLSILIILISFWENSVAKLRLFRLPDFLGIAFILALLGLVSHFLIS